MIRSFGNKETERIFFGEYSGRIPVQIQQRALNKLWVLDAAKNINDLRVPPSNHLEKLKGNRVGQYSIRINKKWRIAFRWMENNSYLVEITDYHS